ncbi:hypothetical protein Glove_421g141 [Diversispora epigaea]|uniref:Uncharacterized protein n=1 Tax=Diversispora epigaea TaxID=1348612 RepID=A0A397GZ92_9GLOM|nr:hypothetical protein Glove_421g141 [Diversispora epigaea]
MTNSGSVQDESTLLKYLLKYNTSNRTPNNPTTDPLLNIPTHTPAQLNKTSHISVFPQFITLLSFSIRDYPLGSLDPLGPLGLLDPLGPLGPHILPARNILVITASPSYCPSLNGFLPLTWYSNYKVLPVCIVGIYGSFYRLVLITDPKILPGFRSAWLQFSDSQTVFSQSLLVPYLRLPFQKAQTCPSYYTGLTKPTYAPATTKRHHTSPSSHKTSHPLRLHRLSP